MFSDIDLIINSTIQKIQHEYLDVDDYGNPKLSAHLNDFLLKILPAEDSFIGDHYNSFKSENEINL